ncbi:MAG: response regulator, partial [Actinobacteria bacterium]|nr:response regulator [Actinomycetota bacterium]
LAANDGDEALEIAGRRHVDMLVTDVMMPGIGGREVSERLREVRPDLKVVFMSGYAEGGIHSGPVLPATTEFLEKPFTFSELRDKVRGLLDG